MQKLRLLYFILLLIGTSCSSQSDINEMINTNWTTDVLIEKSTNEFTPNMILSFGDSIASIHQFGTGQKLFELPYKIKNKKLFLNRKPNPFMRFLEISDHEFKGSFFPGDTTRFRKISPISGNEEVLRNQIMHQSFAIKNLKNGEQSIIYFDEKEVLQFSSDISKEELEFPHLHFQRIPYFLDTTNKIPTIIIGNPKSPKVNFLSTKEFELVNLIIGKIDTIENNNFRITSFKPKGTQNYSLTLIQGKVDSERLTSGEWKWGGQDKMIFNFNSSGKLEITENNKKRQLTWNFDNSGFLIVMEEESGEKLFAIKNFNLSDKRIGLEFLRGKFTDLLKLE